MTTREGTPTRRLRRLSGDQTGGMSRGPSERHGILITLLTVFTWKHVARRMVRRAGPWDAVIDTSGRKHVNQPRTQIISDKHHTPSLPARHHPCGLVVAEFDEIGKIFIITSENRKYARPDPRARNPSRLV
jgi:hypothetical protein